MLERRSTPNQRVLDRHRLCTSESVPRSCFAFHKEFRKTKTSVCLANSVTSILHRMPHMPSSLHISARNRTLTDSEWNFEEQCSHCIPFAQTARKVPQTKVATSIPSFVMLLLPKNRYKRRKNPKCALIFVRRLRIDKSKSMPFRSSDPARTAVVCIYEDFLSLCALLGNRDS